MDPRSGQRNTVLPTSPEREQRALSNQELLDAFTVATRGKAPTTSQMATRSVVA
jgi:hypothetical protein